MSNEAKRSTLKDQPLVQTHTVDDDMNVDTTPEADGAATPYSSGGQRAEKGEPLI